MRVECAAVVRKPVASSAGNGRTPGAPHVTTTRCVPLDSSKARVPAWAAVAARAWGGAEQIVITIDRLLFVLMLLEILHTVRVSVRDGTLTPEPFLVVGLIASIRRILVITLGSSQATQPGNWTPDIREQFNASMLELGVLGLLILVMVLAIYLLRRARI